MSMRIFRSRSTVTSSYPADIFSREISGERAGPAGKFKAESGLLNDRGDGLHFFQQFDLLWAWRAFVGLYRNRSINAWIRLRSAI